MTLITPRRGALAALVVTAALAVGCFRAPVIPPIGGVFTQYRAPLVLPDVRNKTVNLDSLERQTFFLRLPAPFSGGVLSAGWGEANLADLAREKSTFDEIVFADYRFLNVIGVWNEFEVTVYGR